MMVHRRNRLVHRLAAHVWMGFDLDSKLLVCHTCDCPPCFNPDHLFIGTHADNSTDMARKGRSAKHPFDAPWIARKLTPDDVVTIRTMMNEGRSLRSVGEEFGVSYENIRLIRDGLTWKGVGGPIRSERIDKEKETLPIDLPWVRALGLDNRRNVAYHSAMNTSTMKTSKQAAEDLGLHHATVRRLAIAHGIGRKIGPRTWIFSDADIAALRARVPQKRGRKPKAPS